MKAPKIDDNSSYQLTLEKSFKKCIVENLFYFI